MSRYWHRSFLVGVILLLSPGLLARTTGPADAADTPKSAPLTLACSPEKSVVRYGKAVRLRAWVATPADSSLQYKWTTTSGRLEADGANAKWQFTGIKPGLHTAMVSVNNPQGGLIDCTIRVLVKAPTRDRLPRETGRSLLTQEQTETTGYGLYSYVLLGAPPDEQSRLRYLEMMSAYLQLIVDVTRLVKVVPLNELNVTYIPTTQKPTQKNLLKVSAEWLLEHYDYARARALLRKLPGNLRSGPYIVSALKPLSGEGALPERYLYQDLSSIPPHLVVLWLKEFMNQAAQERFWEPSTADQLALKLRTTIGVLAEALPDVQAPLQNLIVWVRG